MWLLSIKGPAMTVKQVWTVIKPVVRGECPKLMRLMMSGSVEAIEPSQAKPRLEFYGFISVFC